MLLFRTRDVLLGTWTVLFGNRDIVLVTWDGPARFQDGPARYFNPVKLDRAAVLVGTRLFLMK